MSVKDRTVLTPMASVDLCTDHMSGFIGSGKPSSPITTSPNCTPYLKNVVWGGIRLGVKTSPVVKDRFQWSRDFAHGCHIWESPGVKSMVCWSGSSPAGCISFWVTTTLSVMSGSLLLQSSRCLFGVLLMDSRRWICIWLWLYYHYDYCIYLSLMLTWVNVLLVHTCSTL
jgi:hypothetical protein